MLEPLLILLIWAALIRVIRVDLNGADLDQPTQDTKTITNPSHTIGVVTRHQLPRFLASIDAVLTPDCVIFKRGGEDQYYVGYPKTNPERLNQLYGWEWYQYSDLDVTDEDIEDCKI
jgi:hypothetical protein